MRWMQVMYQMAQKSLYVKMHANGTCYMPTLWYNQTPPYAPHSSCALSHASQSLATAQQRLQSAQTAADQTSQQAKARYASYISGVNRQQQQAVAQYNQHLYTALQQYAPRYDAAVAQQNLRTAMQATKPTQLLQFNLQRSYNAQKQTYTPLSTQLRGQSSGNNSQNATRSPVAASTPSR